MTANPEQLTCVSMIVCDSVFRDERSKKLVIIGTFNRIIAAKVPCIHPKMVVLFSVTNGNGVYNVSVRIVHERTGHEVINIAGPMKIDDPLAIADINVELQGVVFPQDGKYWVELKADGVILQARPLLVMVAPAQHPEQGHE